MVQDDAFTTCYMSGRPKLATTRINRLMLLTWYGFSCLPAYLTFFGVLGSYVRPMHTMDVEMYGVK